MNLHTNIIQIKSKYDINLILMRLPFSLCLVFFIEIFNFGCSESPKPTVDDPPVCRLNSDCEANHTCINNE